MFAKLEWLVYRLPWAFGFVKEDLDKTVEDFLVKFEVNKEAVSRKSPREVKKDKEKEIQVKHRSIKQRVLGMFGLGLVGNRVAPLVKTHQVPDPEEKK